MIKNLVERLNIFLIQNWLKFFSFVHMKDDIAKVKKAPRFQKEKEIIIFKNSNERDKAQLHLGHKATIKI